MEGVQSLALSTFLEWLVRVGPRWLVTRWLHITPERLAQSVSIQLRPRNPISVTSPGGIPTLDVSLVVHNYGPLDLELDRMVVDVWAGQPIAYGEVVDRYTVRRRGPGADEVRFVAILTAEAFQMWERNREQPNGTTTVHFRAYFESRVGRFMLRGQLEQDAK